MTGDEETEAAHALAWFVGILALVLIVLGVLIYGTSSGVFQRFWQNLVPSLSTRPTATSDSGAPTSRDKKYVTSTKTGGERDDNVERTQ
jgi:hypothetical protein